MMSLASLGLSVAVLDYLAVAVFAVTGALVASRKEMDVIGFIWLATVTGIGGGTVRDLLLQVPVFWIVQPAYIVVCACTAVVVYFTAHIPASRYKLILWLDAVGLALVTVAGAEKGLLAGAGPVIAIVMGVITGTMGGVIRDIIGQEPSIILRKEIYVSAALAGAIAFVGASGAGLPVLPAAAIGFTVCLVIRGLAMIRGWSLPTYKARPGRDPRELGL